MKVKIWDKHGDEANRIKAYYPAIEVVKDFTDDFDRLIVFDGYWRHVPNELRSRCILLMCVDPAVWFTNTQGYSKAIVKQLRGTFVSEFFVPPWVPVHQPATGDDVISLISCWAERDRKTFDWCQGIKQLKRYGHGSGQLGWCDNWEVLRKARWLVHVKHIGWGCNCVIKAVSIGVPVVCDRETANINPVLIPGYNCHVANSIDEINDVVNDTKLWARLRAGCLTSNFQSVQPDVVQAFSKWLES